MAITHWTMSLGPHMYPPFAPCGIRISGPISSEICPSTDDAGKVTCHFCKEAMLYTTKAVNKAKRNKLEGW